MRDTSWVKAYISDSPLVLFSPPISQSSSAPNGSQLDLGADLGKAGGVAYCDCTALARPKTGMRSCLRECRFTQRDLIIKPLILSYKGKAPWWYSKPQPTIPAAYPLLDSVHIWNKIFTYEKTRNHFSHCLPISLDNSCYRSVRITEIFFIYLMSKLHYSGWMA